MELCTTSCAKKTPTHWQLPWGVYCLLTSTPSMSRDLQFLDGDCTGLILGFQNAQESYEWYSYANHGGLLWLLFNRVPQSVILAVNLSACLILLPGILKKATCASGLLDQRQGWFRSANPVSRLFLESSVPTGFAGCQSGGSWTLLVYLLTGLIHSPQSQLKVPKLS